jgi:D-psicose/D-tagatose/L-ribulose 3-epimerase
MNKIGIYFAYWTREWEADYCFFIDKTASLGFDVLEVCTACLPEAPQSNLDIMRERARENNIELTFCVGFAPEYDMASPNPVVRRNAIAYAQNTLHIIQRLGGKIFGGINYTCWPATVKEVITDKRPWLDRSVQSMKEVIKTAEDCGIDYCFEVVNRFEQFLLNTAEEAVLFVNRVDSPRAKILLDTYHMNIEEDSISQAVLTAGPKLGHLHIGENNRKTPGLGHIPWQELMVSLQKTGYKGRIVMEPFVKMGGAVGRDIKVWRDLSGGANEEAMDAAAKAALLFIREQYGMAEKYGSGESYVQ